MLLHQGLAIRQAEGFRLPGRASSMGWGGQGEVMDNHDGSMQKGSAMELLTEFDDCPYCGVGLIPANRTLDHMDPVADGGVHGMSNLVVSCNSCNRAKASIPFIEWIQSLSSVNRDNALMIYWEKKSLSPEKLPGFLPGPQKSGFRATPALR